MRTRTVFRMVGVMFSGWSRALYLIFALFLFRHQLVLDLKLSYVQAFSYSIYLGWLFDVIIVALGFSAARLATLYTRIRFWMLWVPMASFIWLAALANLLYFRYFGERMDWWVIIYHVSDLPLIHGEIQNLAMTWPILLSCGFLLLAWTGIPARKIAEQPAASHVRRKAFVLYSALMVVGFSSFWINVHQGSSILSEQILKVWWDEFVRKTWYSSGENRDLLKHTALPFNHLGKYVAAYRDWNQQDHTSGTGAKNGNGAVRLSPYRQIDPNWPLYTWFSPEPETTDSLRTLLGLPRDRPVNVIVLFLESTRAFELLHPELGPLIFPRFLSLLERHGILFTQAYSSSFYGGKSARGYFSTLSSMLPTFSAPATYIAHPKVRLVTLPQLFRTFDYTTAWMSSLTSAYQNCKLFESLHGTDLFFDQQYFWNRGVRKKISSWGLADLPVLEQALSILDSLSQQGRPFFASLFTSNAHAPFSPVPDCPLPPTLQEATHGRPNYQAYLSLLNYEDVSLGHFFAELFTRPFADNTVVVVLGDHGERVRPHLDLTPVQEVELIFRIPLAIVTKNMQSPGRITVPVHQVDVAPTLARIAGLSGRVTWVGRGLFSGEGRPWVFLHRGRIMYRTQNRGCYLFDRDGRVHSFDLSGNRDPLLERHLKEVPLNQNEINEFLKVIKNNNKIIAQNAIMPP